MRITAFLLCFSVLSVMAGSVNSQNARVSIQKENVPLEEILNEIERQTDYLFVYTEAVDVKRKASVQTSKKTVSEVLNKLLASTKVTYEMEGNHIILSSKAEDGHEAEVSSVKQADDRIIVSGRVIDVAGEGAIGATIMEKGSSNNGTVTDMDGNFSIKVAKGALLSITYIGYISQEVKVNGTEKINIILKEDSETLDEVVVVAYGVQKKVNLTAAVETVNTKVLDNRPVKSASQMLEGVVPNLNISTSSGAPDATSSLNIRGFTGMNTDGAVSGSPLVLVDGVEQSLDFVNPNDIDNISVLKDAAASAIYGSRAPYGVILITTKKGEKGKKTSVNYSGTVQVNQPTMMPHSASSVQFANSLNNAFRNSLKEPYFNDELVQKMQDYIDGKIQDNNVIMPNGRWGEHVDSYANSDYVGYAFKDVSVNTTHDISISGGTAKSTYYAGLGYAYRDGIYNSDIDNYRKYSAILKLDTEITDRLSVGLNSRYVRQETERPNFWGAADSGKSDSNFWNNLGYFPNIPIKNPDGSWHRLSAMPSLEGDAGKYNNEIDDFWLSGDIILKPITGLTIKGAFSYNMQSSMVQRTILQYFVTQPNGDVMRSGRSASMDQLRREQKRSNYLTSDFTVEYAKTLGKHELIGLVGLQTELKRNNFMYGVSAGMYNPEIPSFNVSWGDNMAVSDEINHWATMGYFFSLSYNYDSRYLLDVKGRYDAASKYPRDTRWAFFPSISAGWNIAREAFWSLEEISTFKLTGSFGRLGDQSGGNYLYIPTMGTSSTGNFILGGDRLPYVTMPGIVANNLTWSKPQSIGFGLEVGAFNNRLRAEYYWYQRTVYDQLGPAAKLPEVLGVNPPQTNNAVSETRGWELSLSWRDKACELAGSPLNYNARFILSDYIGYVVKYSDNISGVRTTTNANGQKVPTWTPGQVFGKLYGYESAGVVTDKNGLINSVLPGAGWYYPGDLMYRDINGDGRIDAGVGDTWYSMGDQKEIGWTYPRFKYALQLGLDWKNIDFSLLLDGVGKEERYFNNYSSFGQTGPWSSRYMFDQHAELGYWAANNPKAFFPRAYEGGKNFDAVNNQYLVDLAHLRIKNLSLGYRVPVIYVKKIGLSNLVVNVSVENLGMIYYNSWLNLDPQMVRQSGAGYPIQRTYSLGIKIGL